MMALAAEDLADLRRWAICGAVVLCTHGGIAGAMVTWREPPEGTGAAAGIAMVEFSPVPVAPARSLSEAPPGPEADANTSAPSVAVESPEEKQETEQKREVKLEQKIEEKVETKPIAEPPPEAPPAPDPEVAIEPPPPQEVKQDAPKPQEASPFEVATAPQVVAEEVAAVPAAPREGMPNPFDSEQARKWSSQIHAAILRNKRYPMSARANGQQGISRVFFELDRNGRVIESRIAQSSGVAALDEEALAVLRRAQPFAVPPMELGDRVAIDVPINFSLVERRP